MNNRLPEQDTVRCHSGDSYAQRPLSFRYQDEEYQVAQIAAEWQEPHEKKFLVITQNGDTFELIYQIDEQFWRIRPIPGETLDKQGDQTKNYDE